MLYELVAGQMPFVPRGARVSPYTVLNRVLEGPPRPLAELAPRAPRPTPNSSPASANRASAA